MIRHEVIEALEQLMARAREAYVDVCTPRIPDESVAAHMPRILESIARVNKAMNGQQNTWPSGNREVD